MKRIAIMQPYFLPYTGYFRLMCDVDTFVVLNCVQFPRRGWVHRNRLRDNLGRLQWLTLPLARMPRVTSIADIRYSKGASEILRKNARRFDACRNPTPLIAPLVQTALSVEGMPLYTIVTLLAETAKLLGIASPIVLASELQLPPCVSAQERVLAICETLGADAYVNAPGGSMLYSGEEFARRGVKLEFLPSFRGDTASILQRLHDSSAAAIQSEIRANLA
jgi:hypothetical protein